LCVCEYAHARACTIVCVRVQVCFSWHLEGELIDEDVLVLAKNITACGKIHTTHERMRYPSSYTHAYEVSTMRGLGVMANTASPTKNNVGETAVEMGIAQTFRGRPL